MRLTGAQALVQALVCEQVAFAFGVVGGKLLPAAIDCQTQFVPHPCMAQFGRMNRYGFDALTRPAASS
jgi:hypothetical protein